MNSIKKAKPVSIIFLVFYFLVSCQMGDSNYMSDRQRKALQADYDSMQSNYKTLLADYNASKDSLPESLKVLYGQIQNMHQQMDSNHQVMMSRNMGRHMEGNKMMKERMQMGMQMQTQMTGEWYGQMMAMHQQMAQMHQQEGEESMARINERLSQQFGKMRDFIPGSNEETKRPFNEQGDPALLNSERLFVQNCSSCHGNDAQGVGNIFPPLVNTKWITGDKSVPVRVILNGLHGNIDVNGTTYQGVMPSFKARLSASEIASIINFLREESDGDFPTISQQEVINIGKKYSNRTEPWRANELIGD